MKSNWIVKVGNKYIGNDHDNLVVDRSQAHKWHYKKDALEWLQRQIVQSRLSSVCSSVEKA